MSEIEQLKRDMEKINTNLSSALQYEKDLNQQLMGRLDMLERVVEKMLRLLIDKATERGDRG